MLAIPMLGLAYLTANITLEKLNIVRQMNILQEFSEITIKSSLLIHELQKERGLSAGLISSNRDKLYPILQQQRIKTDIARQELSKFLTNSTTTNISSKFQTIFKLLKTIETNRHLIDKFEISLKQQLHYYSGMIAILLNNINHIPQSIDINKLNNKMEAYSYLLQAKEMAGIERATLYP
ncbi:MAG: nitrate- and nitrite sensing domain-containing protein, partial [Proteobacteria bacterium]|nr:nitrate- and nitrite sensing domain-containing protein [Pseudomonadota bacterium]